MIEIDLTTARESRPVTGEYVVLDGESHYRIRNSQLMPEFFMSLVGSGDHWMFISSTGALTAGRRNPDHALFPYGPDDKISATRDLSGPTTVIRYADPATGLHHVWEPFSSQPPQSLRYTRNLYKTPLGDKIAFEERHEELGLEFRYDWRFSQRFGFVRTCRLTNTGPERVPVQLLDGLRNVLPSGVGYEFWMPYSNLANAYKRSELLPRSNLGLFYLSSIPTDRAEPSEGLRSTVAWQVGLQPDATLLSDTQLELLRTQSSLASERDVRGKPGSFLTAQNLVIDPGETVEWRVIADIGQDHSDIVRLDEWLQHTQNPADEIDADVAAGRAELLHIVASADGLQCGANQHRTNRHLSNTVFNVMRGGVPLHNYDVSTDDFSRSVAHFHRATHERHRALLDALPARLPARDLLARIRGDGADRHLVRLCLEYLPLAFSRRHGDPTRPWNRFSIDHKSEGGAIELHYQGNWRDIFQNWEALGFAFPELLTSMVCRFVNATTADGYNPYRITKDGFDWEEPDPEMPWSNIGYWGDHQIIYLLKLLELSVRFEPRTLLELLDSPAFVHAQIPYRIKGFDQIKQNPRDTIDFDDPLAQRIRQRVAQVGADGALLQDAHGEIHYVTLFEKLLTLSLAKLANFVPDGGIWLNTQRPEWNDANNALVGNGVSVITACYLYRWFGFLHEWIAHDDSDSYQISEELHAFVVRIVSILGVSFDEIDDATREQIVGALSRAGTDYRNKLYEFPPSGQTTPVTRQACLELFTTARHLLERTIRNNERNDGLFDSYNLLHWSGDGLDIEHLYEMLEGQVAALSSGLLSPEEAVRVLDALRASALYRPDQQSYLLYPDRQLPSFLDKNRIARDDVDSNPLLQRLLADGDERVVKRDVRDGLHFHSSFRNASDVAAALRGLGEPYESLVDAHAEQVIAVYEKVFGHRQFTGRSGTFFAYEGLGSIYWHMVSKLRLAVTENHCWAIERGASDETLQALRSHLQAIRHGIGAEKSPLDYGAFPSDPYSHTPENSGVKQPGMTGQVKEDLLARFAELGVHVEQGRVGFSLKLFDFAELLTEPTEFRYFEVSGTTRSIEVPRHGFAFTLFQVPVVYHAAQRDELRVTRADGRTQAIAGHQLDHAVSNAMFSRNGEIERIDCGFRALTRGAE